MIIFLMVLASLAIVFFVGAAIYAFVLRKQEGVMLNAPPAKEGEDVPADQPVSQRQMLKSSHDSRILQAFAAFFAAILAAIGLKQLNDQRIAQESKPKPAR